MTLVPIEQRIAGRKAKELYALIRRQGTVSKHELQTLIGWTGSTLTRTLDELTTAGLINIVGFGDSTGGRRPILYETSPSFGCVFGLDLSRLYSRLHLYDLHLNTIASHQWVMTEHMTPDEFIRSVASEAKRMLEANKLSQEQIIGMGIGAVGPVDRFSGTIINPLHFPAPGWTNVPIVSQLEQALSSPVILDNGANAAVIGEWWADRRREYDHILYVHVGVGLRAATLSGGKIVYGAVDMEGSIGQMIIQTDGPRLFGQGNYGALEAFVSLHALEEQARARLKQGRESSLRVFAGSPDRVEYRHLLQALAEGDPLTLELFTQAASYFGIGLSNLLNILHPQKVILGGHLISSHPAFFHNATRTAVQNTHYYPNYQVVFSLGTLGEEAIAAGAAAMVVSKMAEF